MSGLTDEEKEGLAEFIAERVERRRADKPACALPVDAAVRHADDHEFVGEVRSWWNETAATARHAVIKFIVIAALVFFILAATKITFGDVIQNLNLWGKK